MYVRTNSVAVDSKLYTGSMGVCQQKRKSANNCTPECSAQREYARIADIRHREANIVPLGALFTHTVTGPSPDSPRCFRCRTDGCSTNTTGLPIPHQGHGPPILSLALGAIFLCLDSFFSTFAVFIPGRSIDRRRIACPKHTADYAILNLDIVVTPTVLMLRAPGEQSRNARESITCVNESAVDSEARNLRPEGFKYSIARDL